MYKVGVMMMGRARDSPKKVKEIILEVEGKTKMSNIAEYLLQMEKITNTQVDFALEKNGQPLSDSSNITQALKYTTPVNGIIKLYLYEREDPMNLTDVQLAQPTAGQNKPSSASKSPTQLKSTSPKNSNKPAAQEEPAPSKCCCC